MEQVRDSSKSLQLLSELLLSIPFSEPSAAEAHKLQKSAESHSDRTCEDA